MNGSSTTRTIRLWSLLLKVAALAAITLAVILNPERAGDWFCRSEKLSRRYLPFLLSLRLLLGIGAVLLFILSSKIVTGIASWWRSLTGYQRIGVQFAFLVLFAMAVYVLSVYFRENIIFLEDMGRHRTRYKMLGFEIIVQDNPWSTSDFFVCTFLGMAAVLSWMVHALWHLGAGRSRGQAGGGQGEAAPSEHSRSHGLPQRDRARSAGAVWILFALGFYFAALDEYFAIHEFIGDNVIKRRDDVVMMAYVVLAAVVLARYIRYLSSFRRGMYMFIVGTFVQALAVICDRFEISAFVEEGLEELAALFYLGAVAMYLAREVLLLRSRASSSPIPPAS